MNGFEDNKKWILQSILNLKGNQCNSTNKRVSELRDRIVEPYKLISQLSFCTLFKFAIRLLLGSP